MNLTQYKLPLVNADVYYLPHFLSDVDANHYFEIMTNSLIFDKKEHEGRLTALYGSAKSYQYALNVGTPIAWTPELQTLKTQLTNKFGWQFDVCLLNYYKNGREKFAFHADQEEIGNPTPIISISLGAERKFYFRGINSDEKHCIVLAHGSLLIIPSLAHEYYLHSLPADNSIKTPRLNLTFRQTRPNNNPSLPIPLLPIPIPLLSIPLLPILSPLTTLVNLKQTQVYDVYIGRPTKWGNPFKIGQDGTRDEVVEKYRQWIQTQPELLQSLTELKGKILACSCVPAKCHGHILIDLIHTMSI